jgi:hypothetical protein
MHQKHLFDVNHASAEPALTIGKIQVPHAFEPVIKLLFAKLWPCGVKSLAPLV